MSILEIILSIVWIFAIYGLGVWHGLRMSKENEKWKIHKSDCSCNES